MLLRTLLSRLSALSMSGEHGAVLAWGSALVAALFAAVGALPLKQLLVLRLVMGLSADGDNAFSRAELEAPPLLALAAATAAASDRQPPSPVGKGGEGGSARGNNNGGCC